MTRERVIGGGCDAVIWMPPLQQEQTQSILKTILSDPLITQSTSRAAVGEASDTIDAYVCFTSVPGQEEATVQAIKTTLEKELPQAGLEVLGPFIRD